MTEKPPGDSVTQDEYVAQTKSSETFEPAGHHRPGAINIVENPLMVCYHQVNLTALPGMMVDQVRSL